MQHTRLGLGTPFPEESFAKLCSALWLTLGRLQQQSRFCGISECNISVTCRLLNEFNNFNTYRMPPEMTWAVDATGKHLCEGLSDCDLAVQERDWDRSVEPFRSTHWLSCNLDVRKLHRYAEQSALAFVNVSLQAYR